MLELSAVPVNVSEGVFLDRKSRVNPIKCDFTFSSGISLCKHSLMDHPPVGLRLLCRRAVRVSDKPGPVVATLGSRQSGTFKWV